MSWQIAGYRELLSDATGQNAKVSTLTSVEEKKKTKEMETACSIGNVVRPLNCQAGVTMDMM